MNAQKYQHQGFTFIGLLVIISISGILLAAVGIVWKQNAQREKEQALLYYGDQYRKAITSYFDSTPGGAKQFPKKLTDLVLDKRFPNIRRHIRILYPNPMRQDETWQLVIEQGRIKGVTTNSALTPIKVVGFDTRYKHFEKAKTYADWQFVYDETAQQNNTGNASNIGNTKVKLK